MASMAFTPLKALNAFVVVARRLSYARAAKELGVSTSALSQSVRQLEERLGVTLISRTSRNVALTEAGQRLLESAGPALEQALDSLKAAALRSDEVSGRVRLTVPSAAVSLLLVRLIPLFVERYPRVSLEVSVDDQFVNIITEGFDAGIRLFEAIERDMVQTRLMAPTRLVIVGAPSYFKRCGTPQSPSELAQHACICTRMTRQGEPWVWELERDKKTWRIPVTGPVTTNDASLRRSLALSGVGLLYALEAPLADDIEKGRLQVILEEYAPTVPGLFLYFPSRAQSSPAFRAFVDLTRELSGPS
jgi:DNA-binding transcriptional LysR family regulator